MRKKKVLAAIEGHLAQAKRDIEAQARRLKMLECPHERITFITPDPQGGLYGLYVLSSSAISQGVRGLRESARNIPDP